MARINFYMGKKEFIENLKDRLIIFGCVILLFLMTSIIIGNYLKCKFPNNIETPIEDTINKNPIH
jgi:hypothetical protein